MLLPIQNSISIVQDQAQLKNKEKELKKLNDLLIKLEEKSQEDSKALKIAQDHFHAVSAGLSSNEDGEDKTLADQIMSKSMKFCWLTRYSTFVLFHHLRLSYFVMNFWKMNVCSSLPCFIVKLQTNPFIKIIIQTAPW